MFKRVLCFMFFTTVLFSQEIVLGVVPQQSPLELSKKWLKVTDYLDKKTGIHVVFKTEKSIDLFEEKLYNGQYDIAYMNPYHFIIANKRENYNAFVRSNENIVGIILGKKDKEFNVKEAHTQEEKQQGLMNVKELPSNEGMIFYYDEPDLVEMWMKDTLIPLDIIFINEDQEVIAIEKG